MTKSPFLPSSSTICPRNGPKMDKNGLNVCYFCQSCPKPRMGRILGCVAQNQVPRAPSPPATPYFLWFPSLRIAQRDPYTPVPVVTSCSWRAAHPAQAWGQRMAEANGGSTGVPRARKFISSKVVPRPLGMLKQLFLGHFEPVVARYGPWKIPKCIENWPFQDQKWVKNGSKMGQKRIFPKVIVHHMGCSNKCF